MAQRERHYSCFNLNALVVVEMNVAVNHIVGICESFGLVPVNAFCLEDGKEIFSRAAAYPRGYKFSYTWQT